MNFHIIAWVVVRGARAEEEGGGQGKDSGNDHERFGERAWEMIRERFGARIRIEIRRWIRVRSKIRIEG